jgi:hypothetical protein
MFMELEVLNTNSLRGRWAGLHIHFTIIPRPVLKQEVSVVTFITIEIIICTKFEQYTVTLNGIKSYVCYKRGLLKTPFSDPERGSEIAITKYFNDVIVNFFP